MTLLYVNKLLTLTLRLMVALSGTENNYMVVWQYANDGSNNTMVNGCECSLSARND